MPSILARQFDALASTARDDLKCEDVTRHLISVIDIGLDYLQNRCQRVHVESSVADKAYFAFAVRGAARLSRPINAALFDAALTQAIAANAFHEGLPSLSDQDADKVLYTSAMAYCAANDLTKVGDKKTPGTYFEILIGHLVARTYDTNPQRSIQVLNLDLEAQLPTDFIFDLGEEKARIHLPVKTSTRERVIQVWAHQRVLDGVYGVNRIRGILVCMNETNMRTRTKSVVEVCLPGQWAIYQMFIAQLHRVYYLDIPDRYRDLGSRYPFIQVKPLSQFFHEAQSLVTPQPL